MKYIELILNFDINRYIFAMALVFVLIDSLGLQTRIKRAFKIKITEHVKLIDCFPCLSFWISLIVTFNLTTAFAVFITAKFYEAIRFNR